jgi:hypothetical protein
MKKKIEKDIMEKRIVVLADWLADNLTGDAISWIRDFLGINIIEDDLVIYKFLKTELDEDANFDLLIKELKNEKLK